jgi:hypothetical protein
VVNSRRKGHDFEREMVCRFRAAVPQADVRRGLQFRDGAEAPDVDCPPWHVECKRGKQPNVRAALEQARRDAKPGRIPVAVIKDDRRPAMVVMGLEDFLVLAARVGAESLAVAHPAG